MKFIKVLVFLLCLIPFVGVAQGYEVYKVFNTSSGFVSDFVYDLQTGPKGKLWIATDNGLSTYNGIEFQTYNTRNSDLISDYITGIILQENVIIVAYKNGGFAKHYLAPPFNLIELIKLPKLAPIRSVKSIGKTSVLINNKKIIFFTSEFKKERELSFDIKKNEPRNYDFILSYFNFRKKEVNRIYLDENNIYWVATQGKGLYQIINKKIKNSTKYSCLLPSSCCDIGAKENICVTLSVNGDSVFVPPSLACKDIFLGVEIINLDTLIIGVNGVYNIRTGIKNIAVRNITCYAKTKNKLLIGTLNNGLYIHRPNLPLFHLGIKNSLPHSTITFITVADKQIWAGTPTGLFRLTKELEVKTIKKSTLYEWVLLKKIRDTTFAFSKESGVFKVINDSVIKTKVGNLIIDKVVSSNSSSLIQSKNQLYLLKGLKLKKINFNLQENESLIAFKKGVFYLRKGNVVKGVNLSSANYEFPKFEIKETLVNGLKSNETKFKPGTYDFVVSFSPVLFNKNKTLEYAYRKVGELNEWSDFSAKNSIELQRQNSDFEIEIKARIKGSDRESKIQNYKIAINQPFLKNSTLVIVSIVSFCLLLVLIRNVSISRSNKKLKEAVFQQTILLQEEKNKLINLNKALLEFETVINKSNNPIAVLSNDKSIKWSNLKFNTLFLKNKKDNKDIVLDNILFDNEGKPTSLLELEKGIETEVKTSKNAKEFYQLSTTPIHHAKDSSFLLLFSDVTKQKSLELKLKNAKHHAEESERLKTEFLDSMNHEIRNPLTAIMGFSEMMLATDSANEIKDYTLVLNNSAKNLLDLINNALDLSRLEVGGVKEHLEVFNLKKALEDVINLYRLSNINFNNQVLLKYLCKKETIKDNKVRLTQVLYNILGNALKFTKNGVVEIEVKEEVNKGVLFSVKDSGTGMFSNDLDVIFEKFKQSNNNQKKSGSGLGLFLSKKIVEQLGGEITIDSILNKGTVVQFYLPFTFVKKTEDIITLNDYNPVKFLSSYKILLVEDDQFNQTYLQMLLKKWGHNVTIASDGKKALEILETTFFNVVILDMYLPKINGFQVLEAIKELSILGRKTHFIAVSASKLDRSKLKSIGFYAFLQKPFLASQLAKVLNSKPIFVKKEEIETIQPFDFQYIDYLKLKEITEGDEQFIYNLLLKFNNDFPTLKTQIIKVVERNDVNEYKKVLHQLKSTFGYLGLYKELELANQLKEALQNKDKVLSEKRLGLFMLEIKKVIKEIGTYLNNK